MFSVSYMCLLVMVCVCNSITLQTILLIFDFNICSVQLCRRSTRNFHSIYVSCGAGKIFHKVMCLLPQFLTLPLTLLILRCNVNATMLFSGLLFCFYFVFKAKCPPVSKAKSGCLDENVPHKSAIIF